MRSVSDAAGYAPNTFFNEFTARKLSNARFRGVGASPSNPGVTTYIDGVPQLNANSSSLELVDVDQIEFVRGPQSALFGRNALGGIINITSGRPSLKTWTGGLVGPYGNFSAGDLRASASGPLVKDTLAVGVGFGYSARDGFTKNDVTGHDLDSRSAVFGKGQLLWKPAARWEARALFNAERARDGDYALNDLASAARQPVSRLAQRRRLHAPRHPRADGSGLLRGAEDRLLDDHRLPEMEDRRSDRPRLHGAAAHHAHQRREGLPVHRGSALRVRESRARQALRSRHAEVAGRRVRVHAEATSRMPSTTSRPSCCRRSWASPSASIRRNRRSTIAASASTVRRRSRSRTGWTSSPARAATASTRKRT